jgi:hypothetical protein
MVFTVFNDNITFVIPADPTTTCPPVMDEFRRRRKSSFRVRADGLQYHIRPVLRRGHAVFGRPNGILVYDIINNNNNEIYIIKTVGNVMYAVTGRTDRGACEEPAAVAVAVAGAEALCVLIDCKPHTMSVNIYIYIHRHD